MFTCQSYDIHIILGSGPIKNYDLLAVIMHIIHKNLTCVPQH